MHAFELIFCRIHPYLLNAGVDSWLRELQEQLLESFAFLFSIKAVGLGT